MNDSKTPVVAQTILSFIFFVFVCMPDQRLISDIFPNDSSLIFLRQGLSLNPGFTSTARLAVQWVPGNLLAGCTPHLAFLWCQGFKLGSLHLQSKLLMDRAALPAPASYFDWALRSSRCERGLCWNTFSCWYGWRHSSSAVGLGCELPRSRLWSCTESITWKFDSVASSFSSFPHCYQKFLCAATLGFFCPLCKISGGVVIGCLVSSHHATWVQISAPVMISNVTLGLFI